ncbi:hypothetical protein BO71DRAFT_400985 [Aspergillus ellipticus CBS 707.79]|uniref:Uncharacterized protein n=1 Tax=Aspergillus ellipticus CBS 707.79 TaxID=1448320 RepID=A0A319D3S3_9EURO|nr:hypothetical protein BO71DRAFT_400985 [Aspergillus ellipticus CBS 707.79]
MATVSMTSELEPYLASLRSYLAANMPPARGEDDEELAMDPTKNHDGRDAHQEQSCLQGGKDGDRVALTRPVMKNRSCRTR